jgi:hypothetical protein
MSNGADHQGHEHSGGTLFPPLDATGTDNADTTPPAKRGGGPRNAAGKRASSMNAVKHGATSSSPVTAGESQEDFDARLEGLRAHYGPVGTFEDRCVYEIAVAMQILDRIYLQTRDLIDVQAQKVDPPRPASFVKSITHSVEWSAFSRPVDALEIIGVLGSLPEERGLTEDVFHDCVLAISTCFTGVPMESVRDQAAEGHRTAGHLRRLVTATAATHGMPNPAVIDAASELLVDVVERAVGAEEKVNKVRVEIAAKAERKARAHLPAYDDYSLLMRYKKSTERSLQEWINLLEASQRARSGDLPPPIRIQGLAS